MKHVVPHVHWLPPGIWVEERADSTPIVSSGETSELQPDKDAASSPIVDCPTSPRNSAFFLLTFMCSCPLTIPKHAICQLDKRVFPTVCVVPQISLSSR